jgi:predicted dehydrogenase
MGEADSSITRRQFLGATAGSTILSAVPARAWTRAQGANDRVRLGVIGCGSRGTQVSKLFLRHPDAQFVAAADVFKTRLDSLIASFNDGPNGATIEPYEDYRRLLDRKDVDAVLIATPDHWHCQIVIDAIAAGKDIYVEKPLSNTVDRAVAALQAYRRSNRVVQLGTQQRSGQHFQEAAQIIQSGELGKITHAVLVFGGNGYGRAPEPETPPPAGLNWDMFQGPAPRHAYKQSRQTSWRGWWDYGGGLITDWGVHLTDVALWYMNAQHVGPLLTSAAAQYVSLEDPRHEQSPDAVAVTWQYPNFVMSYTNAVVNDAEFGRQGNYFFSPRGSLLIHRGGYEVRANPVRGGGPIEPRRVPYSENYQDDPHTIQHARNFLDCIKSRQKPVSDLEIGFYASLPCLLGVMAVREGKSFKWDDEALKAVAG